MCLICVQYQLGKMNKREAYTALRELTHFFPEEYLSHKAELDRIIEETEEKIKDESYTD